MLKTQIIDGGSTPIAACVDDSQSLYMIESPFPPKSGQSRMRIFRQHLTTDGLISDGTNQNMLVDGSSTNVDFYVGSSDKKDRYICIISFLIVDASQTLSEFGNLNTALTNGCRLFYGDDQGEVDIHDALKTNFDFIRLCVGSPSFGDGATAFRAANIASTSEGYLPTLDLRHLFGFKWGVALRVASSQRLTLRIRDDVSGLDQFDAICYGFERIL
jgi:hypothetical protein